jgi:hypothetical protein
MKSVIDDPEVTESLLRNAGFTVTPLDMGFTVTLTNRKVQRAEVADVLGCETEDLVALPDGVLVK